MAPPVEDQVTDIGRLLFAAAKVNCPPLGTVTLEGRTSIWMPESVTGFEGWSLTRTTTSPDRPAGKLQSMAPVSQLRMESGVTPTVTVPLAPGFWPNTPSRWSVPADRSA